MPTETTLKQAAFIIKKPKVLQVVQLGLEPSVLRQKAKPVKEIFDEDIESLIDDLLITCADSDEMGMAAPQVNESLRVIVVASHPSTFFPDELRMIPMAMINPKIVWKSQTMSKDWESCPSFPGMFALVSRHADIWVEFKDRKGDADHAIKRDGLTARVIQHEIDHLNGIMFFDRAKRSEIITEKEYLRLMAEKAKKNDWKYLLRHPMPLFYAPFNSRLEILY